MQKTIDNLEPSDSPDQAKASKRRGPPNRMNDLPYREWMKFQKSFFRYSGTDGLVDEFISFFTKKVWPDGRPSRSLILKDSADCPAKINADRNIDEYVIDGDASRATTTLAKLSQEANQYDFALIDLRSAIRTVEELQSFLDNSSQGFFSSLRRNLIDNRYCCILVSLPNKDGSGFPIPWSIAYSGRNSLKLRDEKVGILESDGSAFFCLIFQSDDDAREVRKFDASTIKVGTAPFSIPAWVIPKPPPRSKEEVLHPAKFPETLVVQFIEHFAPESGVVFDPMAGTGSTIIAALQSKRSGIGIELSDKYASIARRRVESALAPQLFAELAPQGSGTIICADARDIGEMPELEDIAFDYVITSPPYWSMLQNRGSENQRNRRKKKLALVYSDDERDTGNIESYDAFLKTLVTIYEAVADKMEVHSVMTIIVKNVKREHIVYPLGWDLVAELCRLGGKFEYVGTTFWCQDDIGLKPFAVGIHWVSNTLHQYCLHVRKL